MVRTQIYLDEAIHSRLRELSERQGRTVSDLIRTALVSVYGSGGLEQELATLRAITGLWKDRDDIGDTQEYVRQLRDGTRRWKYLEKVRRKK